MFLKSHLKILLLVLVLHISLPVIGLSIYGYLKDRAYEENQLKANLLMLTRAVSNDLKQNIRTTEGLLKALSGLPFVTNQDWDTCQTTLSGLIDQFEAYTLIGVADINGDFVCISDPLIDPVNISDRAYFQNAIQTGSFAFGEYQIGRVTQKPVLVFANPIINQEQQITGVVFAGVDLEWLDEYLDNYPMPENIVFTILDSNGVVMARTSDAQQWVGKNVSDTDIAEYILSDGDEGNIDATGIDDVEKTYAYKKVTVSSGSKFYVYTGLETDYLSRKINQALVQNTLVAIVTIILVLTVAFIDWKIITRRFIKNQSKINNLPQQ